MEKRFLCLETHSSRLVLKNEPRGPRRGWGWVVRWRRGVSSATAADAAARRVAAREADAATAASKVSEREAALAARGGDAAAATTRVAAREKDVKLLKKAVKEAVKAKAAAEIERLKQQVRPAAGSAPSFFTPPCLLCMENP